MLEENMFVDDSRSLIDLELEERASELLRFNHEVELILSPGSPTFTSLRNAVTRLLIQFGISRLFGEAYVINEAYLRGDRLIRTKGIPIRNTSAWLRKTCFNIIRELKRGESKYSSLSFEIADKARQSDLKNSGFNFDLEREMMHVKLAFQMLEREDQEILNLKIVDGLSWKEIHRELELRNSQGSKVTVAALRKRKERALKKLREHYHLTSSASSSCLG